MPTPGEIFLREFFVCNCMGFKSYLLSSNFVNCKHYDQQPKPMKKKSIVITAIGLLIMVNLLFEACKKDDDNFAPTASFTVTPNSGTTETLFSFDASASTDPEDSASQLQFRWDFDGDGGWDSDWLSYKTIDVRYLNEGEYTAFLEVKDSKGSTGQTSRTIIVGGNGGGGVTGTITDSRDSQSYNTIEIGSQTWLSENMNFETADSWFHKDDPANGPIFGRLYTWEAALNVCPDGWHLPTDDEWKQLELHLGMSQEEVDKEYEWRGTDEGSKLKATTGWNENGNGINSSGFTGLPGGFKYVDDNWPWDDTGWIGWWWSASEFSTTAAWNRLLSGTSDQVERDEDHKMAGLSVRCVKD